MLYSKFVVERSFALLGVANAGLALKVLAAATEVVVSNRQAEPRSARLFPPWTSLRN